MVDVRPFPADAAARRALWERVQREDPGLASEISRWREAFPGTRVVRLQLADATYVERGER